MLLKNILNMLRWMLHSLQTLTKNNFTNYLMVRQLFAPNVRVFDVMPRFLPQRLRETEIRDYLNTSFGLTILIHIVSR